MQQSEKDFKSKMTKLFDSVIGGRYIGFAMKAEGIAVLTANTLYAEDIENLIGMMEVAKHHADQLLENTPKHTREYLYFDNIYFQKHSKYKGTII